MTGWATQERLAAFRGGFPAAPLSARRVAGLLEVSGCLRRQVLDAAAVELASLASLLGCPPREHSPFALERDRQFEQVAGGDQTLPALVSERLGTQVAGVSRFDLAAGQVASEFVRADVEFRAGLTRGYLRKLIAGRDRSVTLLHRPVIALRVGGAPIYVEPDRVGYTATDVLHPVEVRSFAWLDGIARLEVAAAAREMAVHVLAVREFAARLGHDPERIGTSGLLVLPRDLSLEPTTRRLDVAPQVRRLSRALDAVPGPAALVGHLPRQIALPQVPDPMAPPALRAEAAAQAAEAVSALPPRFGDGCPHCPLFTFCRSEQQGSGMVARLGSAAANLCGEAGTVAAALELAHGRRVPTSAVEQALGAELGRAATLVEWVR